MSYRIGKLATWMNVSFAIFSLHTYYWVSWCCILNLGFAVHLVCSLHILHIFYSIILSVGVLASFYPDQYLDVGGVRDEKFEFNVYNRDMHCVHWFQCMNIEQTYKDCCKILFFRSFSIFHLFKFKLFE